MKCTINFIPCCVLNQIDHNMKSTITSTNVTFNFLKGSSNFLNLVVNNINSCVLLLNKKMELVAFNDAINTLFPRTKNSDPQYVRCGEAIGCAYHIDEQKDCGSTSRCKDCELRISAISSYIDNKVTPFTKIVRPFYNEKINIKLQYSTRLFLFEGERYVMMVVESLNCDD